MNRNKQLDYFGNPDIYLGGNNFRRRSSYKHPTCFPVPIPIAKETITNNRINGTIVTRDGNKIPVTEKVMTSHATLKKNIRDKYLPTRKKVLADPPRTKRRDPTEAEVAEGKMTDMFSKLASAIASATPAQKIPLILNVVRQNMANPLPVVIQIHNMIKNDPDIVPIEKLPADAPAEKTLVSWIKRAPRAIADLLKKGKVNILDPLSRAMVKAVGKIKIVDGNVVIAGFSIPLSRLADMGLDGIASLTGVNMPEGARQLGRMLLEQINVNVGNVEEKKQEELELLEEAKHDKDDESKEGFIEPIIPEIATIVDPGPSRPAPKRPEVKEEEVDTGIGIWAPNDPRKRKFEEEMKAREEDIADLKGELKEQLETLKGAVLATLKEPEPNPNIAVEYNPAEKSYISFNSAKGMMNKVVDKAEKDDIIDDDVIEEYRKQIGKADTFSQLRLIALILDQTFQEIAPGIAPLSAKERLERALRTRRAHGNIRVLPSSSSSMF